MTTGILQYRYHGLLWEREVQYGSFIPEFIVECARQIPACPSEVDIWLQEKQDELSLWEQDPSVQNRSSSGANYQTCTFYDRNGDLFTLVSPVLPRYQPPLTCTIDLDTFSFRIAQYPVFDIRHMPSTVRASDGDISDLQRCLGLNNYGHLSWNADTPQTCRASWLPSAPPLPAGFLQPYDQIFSAASVVSPHDILRDHRWPSPDEQVRVAVLEFLVGVCMAKKDWFFKYLRALLEPAESPRFLDLATSLVEMASQVRYDLGRQRYDSLISFSPGFGIAPFDPAWPRPNVCVHYTKHLDEPAHLKAALVKVFHLARSRYSGGLLWGIAFSITHCVIVRIDLADVTNCTHTAALPFLPSWHASSLCTEGITALGRLFHIPPRPVCPPVSPDSNLESLFSKLPVELIRRIAEDVEGIQDLWNLAHAIPQFPQIVQPYLRRFTLSAGYRLLAPIPRHSAMPATNVPNPAFDWQWLVETDDEKRPKGGEYAKISFEDARGSRMADDFYCLPSPHSQAKEYCRIAFGLALGEWSEWKFGMTWFRCRVEPIDEGAANVLPSYSRVDALMFDFDGRRAGTYKGVDVRY
ncbi:hypothetical protein JAAARDRAFT_58740 [Jaapia argillacea MUCL 33604]|uniref:Uncharacterized protein n=1 Tax=Jaapia argillacea MUCL 33604 TaxID=933084 RepID=A0A067PTV6_9AGAM|nr:hypothetical protein JAAARDRAFT_58740 [Jaapia argillacea MUCL 33604]